MNETFEHIVYSKNVIEFVTVSNEFCSFIESAKVSESDDFISKIQKFLPLVYLKASLLPSVAIDESEDIEIEKYVTENHYHKIQHLLQNIFAGKDDYKDVFDSHMTEQNETTIYFVSEDVADIYQDLKNFIWSYRSAITPVMNNALYEVKNNFEIYWGHRLLSAIRIINLILYANYNSSLYADN